MKVSCDVLWKLQIKILQEIIFTSLHLEAIDSDVLGYNTIIASKRKDVQLVADMPHINLQSSCR